MTQDVGRTTRRTGLARFIRPLLIAQWALVMGMFAAGVLVWPSAPDSMPAHWTLSGQPDRYTNKLEGLFALPALAQLVVLGMRFLPRIDPLRARYAEFAGAYTLTSFAIVVVLAGIDGVVLFWVRGVELNVGMVVGVLVGWLLAVVGSVLSQVRRNWFFGIRTPWTLSSERSWIATHRAGRWVFLGMGVAIVAAAGVQTEWALYGAILVCVAGVLGLVAYSYIVWRNDPSRQPG